jgi:hypothetical protein
LPTLPSAAVSVAPAGSVGYSHRCLCDRALLPEFGFGDEEQECRNESLVAFGRVAVGSAAVTARSGHLYSGRSVHPEIAVAQGGRYDC